MILTAGSSCWLNDRIASKAIRFFYGHKPERFCQPKTSKGSFSIFKTSEMRNGNALPSALKYAEHSYNRVPAGAVTK